MEKIREMSEEERHKLEEDVNLLASIRGRHTELVSVLIPQGQNINLVQRQIEAERSTATNIKSKQTRTAVCDALDMVVREMKKYRQTPPRGLAIFCGNISDKEGVTDIKLWAFEPPKPLNVRTYRCDQVFIIEPLQEMLAVTERYGLLAIDRQMATIGLLEGKNIKVLRTLNSDVPGKYKTGGQCLSPDTLIIKDNGEIIELKDAHNPLLIVSENFNTEKTEVTPIITKWENNKELYNITTKYPKFQIKASQDHKFFIRTEKGIEEKPLLEIKEGDYLLLPEKISIDAQAQEIDFTPVIKRADEMKKVNLPKLVDNTFAKILGYYLGDGNHEIDRISFSEQRKDVAEEYKQLIEKCFGIEAKIKHREDKGYYQIRAGSRILAQLFKYIFKKKNKTLEEGIPEIILKSPDNILASFMKGFFDAEGYISSNRVGLGINNEKIAKQLQLTLLRLGIISSLLKYDNRRNPYSKKPRFIIVIDDGKSLSIFKERIGFSALDKSKKLNASLLIRTNRSNVRQIAINGREIARIIRNSGLTTTQFRCPDFFINKRQLSKEVFKKNILDKIKNEELKRRLEMFYNSNLIITKISKIEPQGMQKTIDIETKSHNFLANGIVVHNSAARFERIREGMAKEFFRKVADSMKEIFFDLPKLKGILIGGPMPTKEDFMKEGELVTKLKNLVIAMKDIGYVDVHGLELLVESSQEDIAQQEMIKEKKVIEKFFETLGREPKKAVWQMDKVRTALERGAIDTLLISKKLDKELTEEFEKGAKAIGAEIIYISTENQDGEQFFNVTKGVGAVLRYQIE